MRLIDTEQILCLVCRAVRAMVDIVKSAQQRAKPSPQEWQIVAKELGAQLSELQQLSGGPRKASTNHDKALSEAAQGLLWVTYDPSMPGALCVQPFGSSILSPQTSDCCTLLQLHMLVTREQSCPACSAVT